MNSFLKLIFLAGFIRNIHTIHIIWDKNSDMVDFNEVDLGRMEEVRMPNWLFIYPGTKWCGPGNIAENDNDYGHFRDTDKCCRNHDKCHDIIEGFQSKHNLTNDRFHTKLSCNCDEEFLQCLKTVNTKDSNIIGSIYFNALGTQCFKMDYPIEKCAKYTFAPWKKCIKYKFKEAVEKLYQWFDVPIF